MVAWLYTQCDANFRGVPDPALLDGAARARIIGAFALFVST